MQLVRNIIFDLGGVILDMDFKRTEAAFINLGIANFGELFAYAQASSLFRDYETGAIDDQGFVVALQKMAGGHISAQQVTDAWNALRARFSAERIGLIKKLQQQYRLFLFSNTNAIHLEAIRRIYTGAFSNELDHLFEKAYYSHLINLRKPDLPAFEYVIRDSGVNPAETLFIDDYLVNVEGAKAAGLQAIFLEPGKTLLDLKWEN